MLAIVPSFLLFFATLSLVPSTNTLNNQDSSSGGSAFAYASQQHAVSSATSTKNKPPHETLPTSTLNQRKSYELVQVQIVHRHGDRTPITPMKDEKYWGETLPSKNLLSKIAEGTKIKREGDSNGANHAAGGRGPFGKLTQLGLLQMIQVGSSLREQLYLETQSGGHNKSSSISSSTSTSDNDEYHLDDQGNIYLHQGRLFHPNAPLSPSKISVKSTDFPRTVQSVQALLVGMFPDGLDNHEIEIDARFTDLMIPDPQPRGTQEQVQLEKTLSQRDYLLDKEEQLKHLAKKVSLELKPFIGEDATSVSFGIGEEGDLKAATERPLSFSQLSEIMVCLNVRGLLPESITMEEYETVTSHSAWKWFENLRDSRLAFLAMKSFMNFIMENLENGLNTSSVKNQEQTKLHVFSAHDSSLIGLMCAFRLQQPSQWPEYGSYLKIELFKAQPFATRGDEVITGSGDEYFVRFSLNGNVLKSEWGLGEADYLEATDMIPLEHLQESIKSEHGF